MNAAPTEYWYLGDKGLASCVPGLVRTSNTFGTFHIPTINFVSAPTRQCKRVNVPTCRRANMHTQVQHASRQRTNPMRQHATKRPGKCCGHSSPQRSSQPFCSVLNPKDPLRHHIFQAHQVCHVHSCDSLVARCPQSCNDHAFRQRLRDGSGSLISFRRLRERTRCRLCQVEPCNSRIRV